MGNSYWPTYKRIEQEVIELSYSIHFDDSQIDVYSNQVLDLIIRISTNIESLYEDIYRNEFGRTEPEIGPMIKKLGETFSLKDKIIYIANENFHFHKELKKIKPFEYEKKSKDDFYSIYNALKHNRSKNIEKANIYTLFRALAAFYVLCVIYDDKSTPIQNDLFNHNAPLIFSYNTEIFSANVYDEQLDYAQKSISFLSMRNMRENILAYEHHGEMLKKFEKNAKVKFREQCPKECLFMAGLTPEYLNKLREFESKYQNNSLAVETELKMMFGDHNDEKTYENLGVESLDVIVDHILLNLEKNISVIVVNRDNSSGIL